MKISLRNLLLLVALIGAALAAIAQPSLLAMRLAFTFAVLFMAYSLAGAIACRGKPRTFWIGSTTFAAAYFVLLLDGQMIDFHQQASMLPRALITQQLLDWLAEARGIHVRSGDGDFRLFDDSTYLSNGGGGNGAAMPGGMGPRGAGSGGGIFDVDPGVPSSATQNPSGAGIGMMPAVMPPAVGVGFTYASYNHFLITGHCIFVILIGFAGGALSKRMFTPAEETSSV